jgi:hypothetical protein
VLQRGSGNCPKRSRIFGPRYLLHHLYAYDNNSSSRTVALREEAGAIVRTERMRGDVNIVWRMFADIDADIYVLADGDATYYASVAPRMIEQLSGLSRHGRGASGFMTRPTPIERDCA